MLNCKNVISMYVYLVYCVVCMLRSNRNVFNHNHALVAIAVIIKIASILLCVCIYVATYILWLGL